MNKLFFQLCTLTLLVCGSCVFASEPAKLACDCEKVRIYEEGSIACETCDGKDKLTNSVACNCEKIKINEEGSLACTTCGGKTDKKPPQAVLACYCDDPRYHKAEESLSCKDCGEFCRDCGKLNYLATCGNGKCNVEMIDSLRKSLDEERKSNPNQTQTEDESNESSDSASKKELALV